VNPTTISIFDLNPSEKLQLVEDLWDDLAATPKGRPDCAEAAKAFYCDTRRAGG
jgi:putative addiction module component (TIGR02574 family)